MSKIMERKRNVVREYLRKQKNMTEDRFGNFTFTTSQSGTKMRYKLKTQVLRLEVRNNFLKEWHGALDGSSFGVTSLVKVLGKEFDLPYCGDTAYMVEGWGT